MIREVDLTITYLALEETGAQAAGQPSKGHSANTPQRWDLNPRWGDPGPGPPCCLSLSHMSVSQFGRIWTEANFPCSWDHLEGRVFSVKPQNTVEGIAFHRPHRKTNITSGQLGTAHTVTQVKKASFVISSKGSRQMTKRRKDDGGKGQREIRISKGL